ncbi:MAG: hypothetical protein FWG87_12570 [Defluviitaleaceae bacterium]|nr:hypothetical protein [Defluviitaleaceae bacterium]
MPESSCFYYNQKSEKSNSEYDMLHDKRMKPNLGNNLLVCKICRGFVGDGFIRPEVRTLVNSGRVTSINAERGNLGTDKSVPYKYP